LEEDLLQGNRKMEWTAWTSVTFYEHSKISLTGFGVQTAALGFGGYTSTTVANTESYNGTSWTTVPIQLNTANRQCGGAAGLQTAGLNFGNGGGPPQEIAQTESYNGTSWTVVNSLNTGRGFHYLVLVHKQQL
jgi:hypothetical protein